MNKLYQWFDKNTVHLVIEQRWDEQEQPVFVAETEFKGDVHGTYASDPSDTPDQALLSLKKIIIHRRLDNAALSLRNAQANMVSAEAWAQESGS